MKKLIPLPCACCVAFMLSFSSIEAQTPWDHNEGLLVTEGSTVDTMILSWWGRMFHSYEIDVSEDLIQWDALPEVIETYGAPIARELNISQANDDRFFMRIRKSPLPLASAPIASLFSETANLKVLPGTIQYIGTEAMRGTFSGGDADELPIDSGWVFSTGEAERWDENDPEQSENMQQPGDPDLEHWMRNQGFWSGRGVPPLSETFNSVDAAGIIFDFEVAPSVVSGELNMEFFFASDEYYLAGDIRNDAMGVFVYELDDHGEIVPESRVNIGVLPETESHSHAINIFNAGTTSFGDKMNEEESGFTPNISGQPPHSFGYSGFTGRITASGGPAKMYGDVSVKTRIRQANMAASSGIAESGWGGVVLKGQHNLENEFSGYAIAFGRDSGDVVFTLYKIEEHNTLGHDTFIIPNKNRLEFPGDTVTVLKSIEINDPESDFQFTENEWYWIRAEVEGNTIRARFWEGDEEDEPDDPETPWAINVTDETDPLGDGFVGVVHLHTASDAIGNPTDRSDLRWDLFEVDDGFVQRTDFGQYQPEKRIPAGWKTLGLGAREWGIIEDTSGVAGAIGGKYLQHDLETHNVVSILKYKGPGKVEGGKQYRVKVVVADAADYQFDSAVFLEDGSIRVVPDGK